MKSPEEAAIHRAELLDQLGMMEQAVVDLNRSGWPTNHPLIDGNRSSFLRDIRMAREGINHDPPNFLLASLAPAHIVMAIGERSARPSGEFSYLRLFPGTIP